MDVGIRELKQHLSEYVERAARGETIRVTDRGEPKALLAPIPGRGRVAVGVGEGWIREAEAAEPVTIRRAKATREVVEALLEDRGT